MKFRNKKDASKEAAAPAADAGASDAAPDTAAAATPGVVASGSAASAPVEPGLQEQLDAARDRLLRLQADFDNFRKRTLREREETYQRANEDLMRDLLTVLDHLDLAIEAGRAHQVEPTFVQGFALVGDQLRASLGRFGLAPFDTQGQPFDPQRQEAVAHMPSAEVAADRVVVQTRRGYLLGNRLLRAAQVVVSSGAPAPEPAAAAPEPPAEEVPADAGAGAADATPPADSPQD